MKGGNPVSLSEAILSAIILVVTAIIIISAAGTTTVVNTVEVPEVEIQWQQRLIHNAINNPYIELSSESNVNDPDYALQAEAGVVQYTPKED